MAPSALTVTCQNGALHQPAAREDPLNAVNGILQLAQFVDVHTGLFAPAFGNLGLRGIDDPLTYRYLEAEVFRSSPVGPKAYWSLPNPDRPDLIWKTLFVENTPLSEATRGHARQRCGASNIGSGYMLASAGIEMEVMTNDPLDPRRPPFGKADSMAARVFTQRSGWVAL